MRKTFDTHFEIKSVDEQGYFKGYGSVFDNVDSYRDIMVAGCYQKTLGKWAEKGRFPAMLWQHDQRQPIGVYTVMREDTKGLYVEGQLALKTRQGAEAFELMKMDALGGLSIGFQTIEEDYDYKTDIRKVTEVALYELSLVTFPANEEAKISSVKDALQSGEVPTERELEKYLRDVGFSSKQAKGLLSCGYKSLAQRDVGKDDEEKQKYDIEVRDMLANLTKTISR